VAKRLVVVAVAVVMLGGAYAAGALGPSVLSSVSGHRLQALKAVTSPDPQTFAISRAPTPIPGAELALNVRAGQAGIFDIRFTDTETTQYNLQGDILVDGVPLAPVGWYFFGGIFANSVERVTAPLPTGRHIIIVTIQSANGGGQVTLAGWTLVAEEVEARP
jgi:hypothetical protein